MATDPIPDPLPGDILQIIDESHRDYTLLAVIEEVRSWGVGAVITHAAPEGQPPHRLYTRLKREQFVVCGNAALVPGELAEARKQAIATAEAVAREAKQ